MPFARYIVFDVRPYPFRVRLLPLCHYRCFRKYVDILDDVRDELGGKIQHRTEVICGVGDDAEGEGGGATTDVDKEQKRMKNHQLLAVCPRLRLRERYKKGMCGTFTATAADTATSAASNGVVGMWCAVP
ncbi:hypothetical protein U1Q18_051122 [Sarracenia purpurea var. burkii]